MSDVYAMHMAGTTTMGPHNHSMESTTMNHDHHQMDHSGMDHLGMDHGIHGMHMNGSMDMKMYFHTGIMENVLFESCMTSSAGEMVGACFAIFFLTVLYEGLKYLREVLLKRSLVPGGFMETKLPAGSSTEHMVMPVGTSVKPIVILDYTTKKAYIAQRTRKIIIGPGRIPLDTFDVSKIVTWRKIKGGNSLDEFWLKDGSMYVRGKVSQMLSGSHFLQTFLHIVQVFISYCLMLVFMTYNVWLCLALILGAGLGYFLFGWKRAVVVDANEHCH